MSVEQDVRQAGNPQQAMLALARGLDALLSQQAPAKPDPWGTWSANTATPQHQEPVLPSEFHKITETEDHTEVEFPLPSEDKQERRRKFEAQFLKLADLLPATEDWNTAYAKGGPMWLYTGNRDLVMSFPEQIKAAMINDVIEDSPKDAHEMGRDLLKRPAETGPGSPAMMIGEGNLG